MKRSAALKKENQARRREKNARATQPAYAGMISLAAITADSLDALLHKIDGEVFRELKAIAVYIRTLRREISALQPTKMHRESIPAAGQELDAIVTATETASNRILECAEQVMAADAADLERYKAFVEARMLTVFEACEFQDLTGQRIARVVETLKQIETRVARFATAARAGGPTRRGAAGAGPNSQEAIDRIFGRKSRRRKRSG